ncbi:MAG: hypothetical protein AAGC74_13005 [Verrucomicrobiota bacterium]
MTLLELTVVILVLLSLVALLFVGVRSWKKGSDRAQSIFTIRNAQQAVRGIQNINRAEPGDTLDNGIGLRDTIFGPSTENFILTPVTGQLPPHPAPGVIYAGALNTYPPVGTLYIYSDNPDYNPTASEHATW